MPLIALVTRLAARFAINSPGANVTVYARIAGDNIYSTYVSCQRVLRQCYAAFCTVPCPVLLPYRARQGLTRAISIYCAGRTPYRTPNGQGSDWASPVVGTIDVFGYTGSLGSLK